MKKHKLWIPIIAAVLAIAVIVGVLVIPRLPGDAVAVYPMYMMGYTDYYSGSTESYGMVTTDKVQTIYLSGTQTVTEILVYPGQTVQKGDVLYTYDTTLSDLAIERKDLANQQLEVSLTTAKAELTALNKMKAIVYKPGTTSTAKTDYTTSPSDLKYLNTVYSTKTTGKTSASPLYVWLQTSKQVDDEMIEYLFSQADGDPNYIYVVFQMSSGNKTSTEFSVHTGVKFTKAFETVTTPDPTETTEPAESTEPVEATEPSETTGPTEATEPSETTGPTDPSESTEPSENTETPTEGEPTPASEKVLTGYTISFFDPPSSPSEDSGTVEWNDGYTEAELAALKAEKQAEIKQLQFDIKMGKAELKIMQKEAESGQVVASFSGTVVDILEPATALETGQPLMKVTGGGGYYVEGSVSELALGSIAVGQTVTVTSWDTGTVYTGRVTSIGSYPTEEQSGYYYGSTNVTYYPYTVFIDESADLQEGFYVSMSYQTEAQAAGILYLQNAFIRQDGNRSYVFVRNADGLLEQRYLEVGVSTDGYMTPVYSGITEEDYLAFPYGKDVVEGAPTYEGTDQDLYGY